MIRMSQAPEPIVHQEKHTKPKAQSISSQSIFTQSISTQSQHYLCIYIRFYSFILKTDESNYQCTEEVTIDCRQSNLGLGDGINHHHHHHQELTLQRAHAWVTLFEPRCLLCRIKKSARWNERDVQLQIPKHLLSPIKASPLRHNREVNPSANSQLASEQTHTSCCMWNEAGFSHNLQKGRNTPLLPPLQIKDRVKAPF
ncbi:hypothetical protein M758_11G088200 [Ceratodon purpureus]|nr:hypothetical protein M758_11G088200 [Ceratodon purpureus]